MNDDDSVFDRVRRTIAGPTPAERAETLADRAGDDPTQLDASDVEDLVELLDDDDREVVGDALGGLKSLADDRPELVEPAVPAVADGVHSRSQEEWYSTSFGEMSQSFMNDLARGTIFLWIARERPEALDPVVSDLVERYDEDTIDPMSTLALAYVVAAAPERVDVRPEPFVELVAGALREVVEPADDEPGDVWENVSLQPMATTGYVDLLSSFDAAALDDEAVEDRRDALETARERGDDEVAEAAAAALDGG